MSKYSRSLAASRHKPLAACVAAVLGLAAPAAMAANTWFVDTCDEGVSNTDATHGSLRWALDPSRAQTGDTIDMTLLGCSRISLHTGALTGTFTVPQNDLTILGPGSANLTITAKYTHNMTTYRLQDRIFNHTGTGTLSLYDLTVEKGYLKSSSGSAEGGCIYSSGSLYLKNMQVALCQTATDSGTARGGAIAANVEVQLKYSTVSFNSANSGATGYSVGGGVYTYGDFASTGATISYNSATGPTGTHRGYGGGLDVRGSVYALTSTISNNSATQRSGGAEFSNIFHASHVNLWASTISGNTSQVYTGGVYSNAPSMSLFSSTVAFNTSVTGHNASSKYYAAGLATSAVFGSVYINMQSSLISNNTYGSLNSDLSVFDSANTTTFKTTGPEYNLVRVPTTNAVITKLPSDTIKFTCPRLGQLRDNGGLTQTHALLSGSAATDTGSNPLSFLLISDDQRGPPYLRPDAKTGLSDIGAYEVRQLDIVFNGGFDDCPI